MQLSTEAWIWLAASPVVAVIVDILLTRALLETLRPTWVYAPWAGRIGKLAAFVGWLGFMTGFWFPHFVSPSLNDSMQEPPGWLKPAALTLGVLFLVAAIVTKPRGPQRSGGDA